MKDVKLRIDFQAALAKLAPAQLQGSWQLPTELARLAIACGAHAVELDIRKSRLAMSAPGARLDLMSLRDLRTLIDHEAPDQQRHHALVALEQREGLALVALAGLGGDSFEIRGCIGDGGQKNGWILIHSLGERPHLERLAGAAYFEVRLTGIRLDATAAEHWLLRNGRFSPVPISIGSQPIPRGFRQPLIRIRLREPLPAALALSQRGEVPRLWLLRHGIISTRATIPGYPAFEAAVEMSTVSSPGALSTALRDAVQPYLEPLVQAAVSLVGQLARHAESLNEEARERAARLLLEASRRERYREQLKAIRVFAQVVGPGAARRLVSIADLDYLVRFGAARTEDGRPPRLDAISPDQDPNELVLAGRQALVLSSFERSLLGELLDVSFASPPLKPQARRSLRHLSEELHGQLSLAWYWLGGRLVRESDLSRPEKTFLAAIRGVATANTPHAVVFCRGNGRIHLTGDGRLLLPRHNPVVEASVRAVERDPDWLYPVLVGLLGGRDLPPAGLRERWSAALAGRSAGGLAP